MQHSRSTAGHSVSGKPELSETSACGLPPRVHSRRPRVWAWLTVKGTQTEASLGLYELPAQGKRVGEEQGFQCPVYPKLAKRLTWDLWCCQQGLP